MRNGNKITIGLTVIAALGVVIFFARKTRKKKIFTRLDRIAEEGYETAADILYPLKPSLFKRKKANYSYNDFSSN